MIDNNSQDIRWIAIYTRKSNDENLNNNVTSIDSQKSACRSYINIYKDKGWQEYPEVFDDPAESGKDLKRPAIQRLLKCIQEGKINGVIVYKLDRLTRNSKDFHQLLELFEKHNVAFISATESIDTKSPQGRLMVNIMVQFAQYDRELDVERSRDFHLARAKKGLWSGGWHPLGYDLKDKQLVVNPTEAELVRRIFNLYVKYHSTLKVAEELNRLGFRRKAYQTKDGKIYGGKPFDMDGVLSILQQKAYIGVIRNTRTKQEFPGQHQPIVETALFEEVQKLLSERNHRGGEIHYSVNKHGFLLKGLISCGECGSAIVPTSRNKNGKFYLYYRCLSHGSSSQKKCPITPLGARKLEAYVIENLAAIGWDRKFLESVALKAQKKAKESLNPLNKERQVIEGRLKTIEDELRHLVNLVKAGSKSSEVAEEIQRLEDVKKNLKGQIVEIEARASHSRQAVYDVDVIENTLQRFAMFINKLPVELKIKILRLMLERVIIFKDRVVIKVHENPIGEIQKMLDKKLVFGGNYIPEQRGAKAKLKEENSRIAVEELKIDWRPQGDSNP